MPSKASWVDLREIGRSQALALAAGVAGIAVSIYLTIDHFVGVVPACPVSGHINCDVVLSSPYAVIGGTSIPTSAAGIIWFAVSAALWLRPFSSAQLAWSAIGLVTVLYLVFAEIVLLGAICLWCMAAHALVLLIFLVALTRWSSRRAAEA